MTTDLKSRIFISCGQKKDTPEVKIANQIKKKLIELGYDPYVAIEEQTTKGFKQNILKRLENSEYFIFIDFKREEIKATKKKYRGSLFSNQELAIAAYLDKPIIIFQEKGVKQRDGILSVIQANPKIFSSRSSLVDEVITDVKKQQNNKEWSSNWHDELSLLRKNNDTSKANYGGDRAKPAIFYHIRVRNNHKSEIAWNCLSYIKKIKFLKTGKEKKLDLIENKWRGVITPSVQIPPKKERKFDGFHIITNKYKIAYLGFNRSITDYTGYDKNYRLEIPGEYEISYIIYSNNFFPTEETFYLSLPDKYEDIDFELIS